MGFNLFGDAKTSDIRVGYISTDRGYVPSIDVCEANRYAKLNPGTTFIIKNRKKIEYKNINEVNNLKPKDVFVPATPVSECGGINLQKDFGTPRAEFYGGGGVGVKGNVVIGNGGGVMGVHLVSGGHGYQYPPIVAIKDGGNGKKGGGVVAVAGLGQTATVKEIYDAEDEFEEYFPNKIGATTEGFSIKQFCEANTKKNDAGYGRRYSPEGKDLGPWDPSMYVNDEKDPIKRQIALFQEYLAALTDPWWFLRKEGVAPLTVVSDNEEGFVKRQKKLNFNPNRTVYPVKHWKWGGSQRTQGTVVRRPTPQSPTSPFEDVVFQIYTQGGSGRGLQFTFTEVGGNHTFVIKADDYTDSGTPRSVTKPIKPNVDYTVTSQGSHRRNRGTEKGLLLSGFGSRGREKGLGTSSTIFADLVGTNNDNDDLQIQAEAGIFTSTNRTEVRGHSTYDLTYKLTIPATSGRVSSSQDVTTTTTVTDIERSFMNDHAISPVPMSNAPGSDFAGMLFTMEWEENFPYPGEYVFKAQCDNVASFYLDGQQVIPKIAKWKTKPTIVKKNLDWKDSDKKGKVYKMRLDLLNALEYKDLVVQAPPQPDPPPAAPVRRMVCHAGGGMGGTDNQEQLVGGRVIVGEGGAGGRGGDDNAWDRHHGGKGGGAGLRNGQSATNPITHSLSDDISIGPYKGGPGGYGVNFVGTQVGNISQTLSSTQSQGGNGVSMGGGGGGNVRGARGGNGGNGGVKILWGLSGRSQEWTRPGTYHVTVPGNIDTAQTGLRPATAKFEGTSQDNLELVVTGTGTVQAEIILETNDHWRVSGTAIQQLRCGSINLSRTRGRRRENLRGSALFPVGRHRVEIIGASDTTGARIGDTRVELDDDATNNFDVNATLTLRATPGPQPRSGVTMICIGGGGSGFTDTDGDRQGSGGAGGAYAWANEDIEAGTRLRIKVGNGGVAPARGGSRGRDSSVEVVRLPPRPAPPPKPKPPGPPGIKVQKVFNTVEWMNKANRQLWRTNVYKRGGFVNTAGVTPFDTGVHLDTNPYAGTHPIKWRNINFPIDGNYTITVAVDDSVNLRFHGPGGDVSIRKEGFINDDGNQPTGKSTYTRFFKKGNYTLDADLEQIPGGKFSYKKVGINDRVLEKEVNFNVKVAGHYGNKITIPGLFSIGKEHISSGGSSVRKNFAKNVEIGKEYDVIITSVREEGGAAETTHRKGAIRFRNKSGNLGSSGSKLEFEDKLEGVGNVTQWDLIQALASEGRFYGVHGNKCKFKIDDNFKTTNTMVLAVDVEVAYATKTVVSAKSWQENPMGVALTVKAPLPPVPKEEPPKQKGRCPNNPMWTTRFPSEDKTWYPVRVDAEMAKKHGHSGKGWGQFLNRWAISPILPLNKPGTDEGGKVFTNSWKVDIPYDGWYQLKGEVDDIARYFIDDDLKLDLTRRKNKVHGTSKFFLTQGLKTLKVEVENYTTITYKTVSRKIFSARDWRRQPPVAPPPPSRGILCHAGGGVGGTDNQEQLVGGRVIVGQGGNGGSGGDDNEFDSHHGGNGGGAGLRSGGNARNPITHSQLDSMSAGRYKGGAGGFGVNFAGTSVGNMTQTISTEERSGGDGVAMGGGGGGNSHGGRSGNGGNGGVKIIWGLTGRSQEWTTPGIYHATVPGGIGRAGAIGSAPPITARFEGTNKDNMELVVSGSGTARCTITLRTDDHPRTSGLALSEMRVGDITLARTGSGRRTVESETLTATGTFVGGQRYPIQIIGSSDTTGARIADSRIELDDDATNDFDVNASISVAAEGEPTRDGVTIICIGGGGSGFNDNDGDEQGSGGSGGAYAWVNEDVESGKRLKIVVGRGGAGRSTRGGARGTDSYVEVVQVPPPTNIRTVRQQQGQVSYVGPNLFHYVNNRWGKVMNKFGVSPANVDANLDRPSSDNVGDKTLEWKNVNFPHKGQYDVLFAADNQASLYINGQQLLFAEENQTLQSDKAYDKINIGTPGRYDVKIVLHNKPWDRPGGDIFRNNPTGVTLEIRKDVNVQTSKGKSWTKNPMGVAGVLIPPPCPKEVGGKGIVTEVIIDDPGTGFTDPGPRPDDPQYPIVPVIKKILPPDISINTNCAKDKVICKPDLGYDFALECGPFGKITKITLIPPPGGFPQGLPGPPVTSIPEIWIDSETGVNSPPTIVFDFVVVPPDVLPPDKIIQVTDLAGIKKTGYYNGKPYYGAVYYEKGVRYAGWYETAGQPIQIYDTMQESIDAQVTTPPSAIQRQGSDVTSNDPRLNIPGTPENLI